MSSLKCLASVKSSHFLSSVIIKHSLAFNACVFKRNMIIIFHEDFEGDMKPGRRIWGSGSKQGNNIHTLTHCWYQTPALFIVAREKQNNLDFHSSYPSGWFFCDCKTESEFEYFEMLDIHTVSNTSLLLQILWFVCLSSTNSMQCYSCCFNPKIEVFVCFWIYHL